MKFKVCKRCKKKMLEKKDYGEGLISFCNYCHGFFNKENEFIEEGSAYWDTRYKKGYWADMQFKMCLVGFIGLLLSAIFHNYLWMFIILLVPIVYIVMYFKLKKENYFRGKN